jgi:hypothetical protein
MSLPPAHQGPLAVLVAVAVPLVAAALFRHDPVPYYALEAAVADVRARRGAVAGWLAALGSHAALAVGVAGLVVGATALLLGIGANPVSAAAAGVTATLLLSALEPAWRIHHEYPFEVRGH